MQSLLGICTWGFRSQGMEGIDGLLTMDYLTIAYLARLEKYFVSLL